MCLILFAQGALPGHPLVVAANRDEFHARPTAAAAFRDDAPEVIAGRDLQAGGTWMGANRSGRFAAVTNFTEAPPDPMPPRSRGELVWDFLTTTTEPAAYLASIAERAQAYRGFNLLVGSAEGLWYFSNRSDDAPRALPPGVYGLSNHLLDTSWPRVERGRAVLQGFTAQGAAPATEALFSMLADRAAPNAAELAAVPPGTEGPGSRVACFIEGDEYGTRSSTVLVQDAAGEVHFEERRFAAGGRPEDCQQARFRIGDA